ncbi:MAG: hypothetical protein AB7F31_01620 [Parachlamydiales bacterium]
MKEVKPIEGQWVSRPLLPPNSMIERGWNDLAKKWHPRGLSRCYPTFQQFLASHPLAYDDQIFFQSPYCATGFERIWVRKGTDGLFFAREQAGEAELLFIDQEGKALVSIQWVSWWPQLPAVDKGTWTELSGKEDRPSPVSYEVRNPFLRFFIKDFSKMTIIPPTALARHPVWTAKCLELYPELKEKMPRE